MDLKFIQESIGALKSSGSETYTEGSLFFNPGDLYNLVAHTRDPRDRGIAALVYVHENTLLSLRCDECIGQGYLLIELGERRGIYLYPEGDFR